MRSVQKPSVELPLDDPEVFSEAASVVSRASAMGLIDADRPFRLTQDDLAIVLDAIGEAGIASRAVSQLRFKASEPSEWAKILRTVDSVLEESPLPAREWPTLIDVVGPDLLAALVGVSPSSMRRYVQGERDTPDEVADRLHFLAMLVADLAGAYNEIGIRRWFERPRSVLNGRSPRQLLRRSWLPQHEGPRRIRELARSLVGSPAT